MSCFRKKFFSERVIQYLYLYWNVLPNFVNFNLARSGNAFNIKQTCVYNVYVHKSQKLKSEHYVSTK